MSGTDGFMTWDPPFGHAGLPADGSIYLDGYFHRDWPEAGIEWRADDGVILIPMLAGNNVVQVPYRGSKAPLIGDKQVFTGGFLVDQEEDFKQIEKAIAKGRAVYFCPGLWRVEMFPAVAGSTYTLTRPLAAGIVPNVTAITHPLTLWKDDVEDTNCATVAGQTVTAVETGEIAVRYMPAFRVVFTEYSRAIAGVNDLGVTFALSEFVDGDFG